jgi:hypothetical protein
MNKMIFESAPFAGVAPTAVQLHAAASMAAGLGIGGRKDLMNAIGTVLGIPPGGWNHGISRLMVNNDIRLVGLLRRLMNDTFCRSVALNLSRARQYVNIEVMLSLCTAARESDSSIGATGGKMVHSFYEGGMDYLWDQRQQLGLPRAITDSWREIKRFVNDETGSRVHPAFIPARDQVVAYAAQMNSSFERVFLRAVDTFFPEGRQSARSLPRPALSVWKAYAFLSPGGRAYIPSRSVAAQSGQPFGVVTAVEYLAHQSKNTARTAASGLGSIIEDPALNNVEWIRIAKVRVAESLFMERLWTTSSELLPL